MHILDLFALKKSHCMAGLRVLKPKQSEEGVGVGEPGIGGVGREMLEPKREEDFHRAARRCSSHPAGKVGVGAR